MKKTAMRMVDKIQRATTFSNDAVISELRHCGLYERLQDKGIHVANGQNIVKDDALKEIYYQLKFDVSKGIRSWDEAKNIGCKLTSFHYVMPPNVKIKLHKKVKKIMDGFDKNPNKKAVLLDFIKEWGDETFPRQDFLKNPMAKKVLAKRKKLLVSLQNDVFPVIKEQFDSKDTKMIYKHKACQADACYCDNNDCVVFYNTNERLLNLTGANVLENLFHEMQHADQFIDVGKGCRFSKNPQEKHSFEQWIKYLNEHKNYTLNGFLIDAHHFYPETDAGFGKDYFNNPLEQGARYVSQNLVARLLDRKLHILNQNINHFGDKLTKAPNLKSLPSKIGYYLYRRNNFKKL